MSDGVMLTETALRCVAKDIELFYKKKAQNKDWCIITCNNAATQFENMRKEIEQLKEKLDAVRLDHESQEDEDALNW